MDHVDDIIESTAYSSRTHIGINITPLLDVKTVHRQDSKQVNCN